MKVPCPSSAAGDTIEMVPSVAIVTQIFADQGPSAAAASPIKGARISLERQREGEAGGRLLEDLASR